jgi:hypothetical protein
MHKQKALTFIAVFLGVLVLYCLMNRREGYVQKIQISANSREEVARQNNALRAQSGYTPTGIATTSTASSPYDNIPGAGGLVVRNMPGRVIP